MIEVEGEKTMSERALTLKTKVGNHQFLAGVNEEAKQSMFIGSQAH